MVTHGILAGAFSPIAAFGVTMTGILDRLGVEPRPLHLFASHLLVHGLACVLAYLMFGGLRLIRAGRIQPDTPLGAEEPDAGSAKPNAFQLSTLVALVVLVLATVAFRLDIGFVAFTLGALLTLAFGRKADDAIARMPWSVLLLLAGVLSYIAVLTKLGTLAAVTDLLSSVPSPSVAVLMLSLVSAVQGSSSAHS